MEESSPPSEANRALLAPEPERQSPEELPPQPTHEDGDADAGVDDGVPDLPYSCEVIPDGLSPREWKLRLRRERRALRKEEAVIRRKERDKKRKELRKMERAEKSRLEGETPSFSPAQPKAKRKKMADEEASKLRVVIDLSFGDLMSEKDQKKIMQQCQRCYSFNRRAKTPLQLYLTSFSSKTEEVWDKQFVTYRNWDVHRKEEGYLELFSKESVVFLTSDSPNTLTEFDAERVYVIGGLVDHNHHKGYCYQKALEVGVSHAQLPISQYIKLNCREVLAVNHVFEILVEVSSGSTWEEAFYKTIPPRKIVNAAPTRIPSGSPASATPPTEAGCNKEEQIILEDRQDSNVKVEETVSVSSTATLK